MISKKNQSYLQKRFNTFGETENFCKFKTTDHNTKKEVERTLLSSDKNDNIIIHYHTLAGSEWTYHLKGIKQAKKYCRTRFKNPIGKAKYISPKGVGLLPFFNGNLINKYKSKEKIPTLYLVEGEFKALVASFFGLDCVGLGSIHGFYAPETENRPYYKELAPEIIELINTCQVENLIYLTDADTLSLNYKVDQDLKKRPNSFYSAVKNFRNSAKKLVFEESSCLKDFYFSHIKNIYDPVSKGIDDLIESNIDKVEEIKKDLLSLNRSDKYFKTIDLKENQEIDLKKYFGLIDETSFYDKYKSSIKTKEFIFNRRKYYFDSENVQLLEDLALKDYVRIGTSYYKLRNQTNYLSGLSFKSKILEPWKKELISDDHGKLTHKRVKKYDGFTNKPDWINHKEKIDNLYNICLPLQYKPIKGDISNTIDFFKHIANDNEFIRLENNNFVEYPKIGNTGTMLLDYISIMVQYPEHFISVPCLLSREQETGKTTFAEYVAKMFEGNSVILRTKDFTGDFNSHWAGKFFVVVDEGDFEDKRTSKDKIKQLTTSTSITLNTKGVALKQVGSFMKMMVCSNNDKDFLNLEQSDKRFWIIPVKSLQKKDESLKQAMFKEIPAFFEFVSNREIFHKKSGRMWFDDEIIMNEHWKKIVNESKAHWKQEVDDFIISVFENYEDIKFFKMPVKQLHNNVKNINKKFFADPTKIRNYLINELGMIRPDKPKHYTLYIVDNYDLSFLEPRTNQKGRVFEFKRSDWIKEESSVEQTKLNIE
ncbi:MAG: primase-helicase family protein [Putridiphycobacter sp.]